MARGGPLGVGTNVEGLGTFVAPRPSSCRRTLPLVSSAQFRTPNPVGYTRGRAPVCRVAATHGVGLEAPAGADYPGPGTVDVGRSRLHLGPAPEPGRWAAPTKAAGTPVFLKPSDCLGGQSRVTDEPAAPVAGRHGLFCFHRYVRPARGDVGPVESVDAAPGLKPRLRRAYRGRTGGGDHPSVAAAGRPLANPSTVAGAGLMRRGIPPPAAPGPRRGIHGCTAPCGARGQAGGWAHA